MTSTLKPQFPENAKKILADRYQLPGEESEAVLRRASFGNDEYYEMMARLDFLPNSPTLFNAGTDNGTLSACFKFDVPDDLDGIFDVARKAALVLKYGGGVGYCLSALRGAGQPVRTTHKVASGPMGFLPVYHATAVSITQGGKRRGAQMAILSCEHPDIEAFIDAKNTEEKANALDTFNISVAATDEWMNKQIAESEFVPSEYRKSLLWRMAENAWRTGDPGCYFIDAAERGNPTPWLGKLTGTNPCGEVPLLDNEACNLGSVNLSHMLRLSDLQSGLEVDWDKLEYTTRLATRYLDEVLDNNLFPHEDISHAVALTRKLGLGVMGWADMLAMMRIDYESDNAVLLGGTVMAKINRWAREESEKLGIEKGIAPCYNMPVSGVAGMLYRNSTRTCIAPTGTISQLAGCSSGIEPHFDRENARMMVTAHGNVMLEEHWDSFGDWTPKYANDISAYWHIQHQAAFQKHVDLAASKTINMKQDATVKDIYDAYVMAWQFGCKGVTVYRDKSRSVQVLSHVVDQYFGEDATKAKTVMMAESFPDMSHPLGLGNGIMNNGAVPKPWPTDDQTHFHGRKRMPVERAAIVHKFVVGDQEGYLTVGLYPDGTPGEIFVVVSKEGSTIAGLTQVFATSVSLALQYGVPLSELVDKFQHVSFEPAGVTPNPEIRYAYSIVDYIFRWLKLKFLEPNKEAEDVGSLCPDCGSKLIMQEGCARCSKATCGYVRC